VNGNFNHEDTVAELAQAFAVSEKTIQRTLAKGNGKFWQLAETKDGRRILFISSRALYETFGAYRAGTKIRMQVKFLQGTILAFRQVIAAFHVHDLAREHEGNAISGFTRAALAKRMNVSLSTAKKELRDNPWVETTPQVEIIGQAQSSVMPVLPDPGAKKNTRTWRGDGGELLVVRQKHNLYRAKLAGLAVACIFARFPRDVVPNPVAYGEQFGCLAAVPLSVQPVGANAISVFAKYAATAEAFERRDREKEEENQGRSCLGEIVQAPAGWV